CMTFIPLLVAEGGALDNLTESAKQTAETFGFNPWLFFSQIISFCIVAFLLKKFAYKPILTVLEERRKRIAEGLANAEKIKQQLADSEKRYEEILTKANAEAQKIIAKAREATVVEREKTLAEIKREVGRLVINTTSKVTGKVLNADDQKR